MSALTAAELAERIRSYPDGGCPLPRGCRDGANLLERLLAESAELGHVERVDGNRWRLTPLGRQALGTLAIATEGDLARRGTRESLPNHPHGQPATFSRDTFSRTVRVGDGALPRP